MLLVFLTFIYLIGPTDYFFELKPPTSTNQFIDYVMIQERRGEPDQWQDLLCQQDSAFKQF